jgi:hypothetical protein
MRNCIISLLEGICHGKEQGSREGARVVGRGGEERRGELWLTSAHRAPPAAASARIRTGRRGSEELEIKGRCRRPGRGRGTSSSMAEEVGRPISSRQRRWGAPAVPPPARAARCAAMSQTPLLPSFPLCGALASGRRVHLFAVYRPVYHYFGGYQASPVAKPAGIPLAYHT